MINEKLFVDTMTARWEGPLENTSSENLQYIWAQIASTFNNQLIKPRSEQWQILQPPTGTGKTQCIVVYCALLSKLPSSPNANIVQGKVIVGESHPGVLVVTRRIDDAGMLAEQINSASGKVTAKAHNSGCRLSDQEIVSTPVLIITHCEYQKTLKALSNDSQRRPIYDWQLGDRGLVVVDEALDLVEHAQVSVENVKKAVLLIPDHMRYEHLAAINYLEELIEWLREISSKDAREQMLPSENILSRQPNFDDLLSAIKHYRLDRSLLKKNDSTDNKHLHETIKGTLESIGFMADQWRWFKQQGNQGTLNTARLILPANTRGAVVMDATASIDLVYKLFKDKAYVIPTPQGARRYENVTMHVSWDHKVGKHYLREQAISETQKLMNELKLKLPSNKNVLVCCHKAVKSHLLQYDEFSKYSVCHWGAIDGRNDWQDYDTVVIFGLPYMPRAWSANTFMAFTGPQSDEWLNSKTARPFGPVSDIREELDIGAISTSVTQAINRVQCRRVIDAFGNCAPTDVYIMLPSTHIGRSVLSNIEIQMPGIRTVEWNYSGASRKIRGSKYDKALIHYLENEYAGEIPARTIRDALGIPKRSFESLIRKIKDETSQLYAELIQRGITYQVTGAGRGARSNFIKA